MSEVNWISGDSPKEPVQASVKIRYKHEGEEAILIPQSDNVILVQFLTPQRAVTPGQAAVFYQGDTVLGGGWIQKSS